MLWDILDNKPLVSDLAIAANCFGPNAAMIVMVTGGDAIPVRTLTADIASVSGSGALMADIDIVSPGIARIEGSVDFDYVSIFSPDFFEKLAEKSRKRSLCRDDARRISPPSRPASTKTATRCRPMAAPLRPRQ